MATTLTTFWPGEVARLEGLIQAVRDEDAAEASLRAVHRALSRWFAERLERLESEARRLRARRARAADAAEANAAAAELDAVLGAIRATEVMRREREMDQRLAGIQQEHRVALLARLIAKHDAAVAAAAAATADAEERGLWAQRLQAAPFDDLAAATNAILNGARFGEVAAALAAIIPASLRDLAKKRKALEDDRRQAAEDRLTHVRGKLEDDLTNRADAEGRVRVKEAQYLRARRTLEQFVLGTPETLAAASTFLAGDVPAVADDVKNALLAAEAGLAAAVTKEGTLFDARANLVAAEARVAELTLLQAAGGPGFVQADLTDAENVRDQAADAVDAAANALTAAMQRNIDAWEARVPDAVWLHYLGFLDVEAELKRLEAIDVTNDVVKPVDTAEARLVASLETERDTADRLRILRAGVARLEDVQRLWAGEHGARKLGQARGDSFTDQDVLTATDPAETRALQQLAAEQPQGWDAGQFTSLMKKAQKEPLPAQDQSRLLELLTQVKEKIRVA